MKSRDYLLLGIFVTLLIALVVFSEQILFHDTVEYFNLVKAFADYAVVKAHSTHSMVYTYLLSPFVQLLPSLLTIKILNVLWLGLIAFLLITNGYKKAFLLFIFSPMVWTSAPQLTPVLPAAFFATWAYLDWHKWLSTKKKRHFIITALSLGFSMALYSPMFIVTVLFILAFMRQTTIKQLIAFTILGALAYLPRIFLDLYLTGMPFYSEIRFFGANLKNALGVGATGNAGIIAGLLEPGTWYFIFLISPLLFMLFKLNWRKYKNELFFIIFTSAFFLITGSYVKYILVCAGVIFILLSKVLNKKLILTHAVLGVIITLIFITPFFNAVETDIVNDLEQIKLDYDIEGAIIYESITIYLWEGNYFLPIEYYAHATDNYYFSQLIFESNPIFYQDKTLELQGNILVIEDDRVKDANLWITITGDPTVPEEFIEEKCYDYLCIYKKTTS